MEFLRSAISVDFWSKTPLLGSLPTSPNQSISDFRIIRWCRRYGHGDIRWKAAWSVHLQLEAASVILRDSMSRGERSGGLDLPSTIGIVSYAVRNDIIGGVKHS